MQPIWFPPRRARCAARPHAALLRVPQAAAVPLHAARALRNRGCGHGQVGLIGSNRKALLGRPTPRSPRAQRSQPQPLAACGATSPHDAAMHGDELFGTRHSLRCVSSPRCSYLALAAHQHASAGMCSTSGRWARLQRRRWRAAAPPWAPLHVNPRWPAAAVPPQPAHVLHSRCPRFLCCCHDDAKSRPSCSSSLSLPSSCPLLFLAVQWSSRGAPSSTPTGGTSGSSCSPTRWVLRGQRPPLTAR
jgi:hypothetical protein